MPPLRRAFVCDAPEPALAVRTNPRTGAVTGRWRLTWAGVRVYVVGGVVQRHLHRPEQVASAGFRRTLAALPAVPAHPPGGRSVVVGGGGPGTVAAEDVVWGAVSPVVELGPVPEWPSVLVPTADVTFYAAEAMERLTSGIRESSLGYDAWIVRAESGAVWVAPDGSQHPYDFEHILDPDDPRIAAADAAGLVDLEQIGGNHFAAPIAAGRGGAQSVLVSDAASAGGSSALAGPTGSIFFADELGTGAPAAMSPPEPGPGPESPGTDSAVALVAALFAASAAIPTAEPGIVATVHASERLPLGAAPADSGWASGWRTPVGVLLLAASGDGVLWTGTELVWVPAPVPALVPAPVEVVLEGAEVQGGAECASAEVGPCVMLTPDPPAAATAAVAGGPPEIETGSSVSVTISVSIGEVEAEATAETEVEAEAEAETEVEVESEGPAAASCPSSVPAGPSRRGPSLFVASDRDSARYTGPMSKVKLPIPKSFHATGARGSLADAQISIEIPDDPALQAAILAAFQAGADQIAELQRQLNEATTAATESASTESELQGQVTELQGQVSELQADAEAGRAAILREVKALAAAAGISIPEGASPLRARLAFVRARCPSALAHVQGVGDDATDAELRAAAPAILAAYGVASALAGPALQRRTQADAGQGRVGVGDGAPAPASDRGARQTRPLSGQAAPPPAPAAAPRSPAAAAARAISK